MEDKKLDLEVAEDAASEPKDWDYIDQGRNWGWTCAKGFKQSPIDIAKNTAYSPATSETRSSIRFGLSEDSPKLKVEVSRTNGLHVVADGDAKIGEIVIHPSYDPKSA